MSCDRSVEVIFTKKKYNKTRKTVKEVYEMIVFRDTGRPLVCTPIILTSFPVAPVLSLTAAAQRPVIMVTYYLSNILDITYYLSTYYLSNILDKK